MSRDWPGVSEGGMFPDDASTVHIPPSLLVASDNRCRFGVRWYGGGLRCYCDSDGSITCGDPSFVAARIDGFRFEKVACEQGHIWEEKGSCRVCECQISGVVLCRRSSHCPLPFLIQPVSVDNSGRDATEGGGDYYIRSQNRKHNGAFTGEFRSGQEDSLDWSHVTSRGRGTVGGGLAQVTGHRIGGDVRSDVDDTEDDVDFRILTSGEMDGSGETTTSRESTPDRSDIIGGGARREETGSDIVFDLTLDPSDRPSIVVDGGEGEGRGGLLLTGGKIPDPDAKDYTISSNHNRNNNKKKSNSNNNSNKYDHRKQYDKQHRDVINNSMGLPQQGGKRRTTVVIVRECKPRSRWLDGCRRCRCDVRGRKYCDDSSCLKAELATVETSTAASSPQDGGHGGKRHARPMQRPPSLSIFRNEPVNLTDRFRPRNHCGRFKVNQKYWSDCNLCLCTPHGPKCTAKNCG
ncbi:uncharacterized protein LOC106011730 [Aplysia californica]|uniref:Uncharacterized protein LOC106011730 n=1 Tax=Aplysia californica TaxID=6500 RepID=A0ABM0ZZL5_APLCA|nr:uncharacterized protein LOC106011730 [Aplysia californica]